jgi:MFS family permease
MLALERRNKTGALNVTGRWGKSMSAESSKGEWASGWPLVLACAVGMSTPSVSLYSLGQFMAPLEHAFGWSRTQTSIGLSLSLAIGVITSPVIGRITDLANARWLALTGCAASGLAVAAFSLTNGDLRLWVGLWFLHAVCTMLTAPVLWLSVIPHAFKAHRGLATALSLSGVSLAAMFAPVLARYLIDLHGWRVAYQLLALIWYGGALVLIGLFFFDRRPHSARRKGAPPSHMPQPSHPAGLTDAGVAKASDTSVWAVFLSPKFLKFAFVIFAMKAMTSGYMIHMAPALVDHGFTPLNAARIAGVAGLAALATKLCVGWMFDRLPISTVSTGIMVVMAAACVLLASFSGQTWGALAGSASIGATDGAMLIMSACIAARLFRPQEFGIVFGSMSSMMALSVAVGPTLASMTHDRFGNYGLIYWAGLGVAALSLLILRSLEAPPAPTTPATAAG